jgi:hypothetical protein
LLPHIAYASAVLGSDGNRVQLIVQPALLHFVFIAGSGDCPAGCIRHDYFYFTLDTVTKTITSNGRLLNDEFRSDRIPLWDVPSHSSVDMYHTLDDVFAGAKSPDWWIRHHAAYALDKLITDADLKRPPRDSTEFLLRAQALARRNACLNALIDLLADPEAGIAAHALDFLREATGQHFSGGRAGQEKWRRWVTGVSGS